METFRYLSLDEAIQILQNIKKNDADKKLILCTINFDDKEEKKDMITLDKGCKLVKESNTIFYNSGIPISHMELYSTQQELNNIIRKGTLRDIIWFSG